MKKIGLQMYSLKNMTNTDMIGALKAVAKTKVKGIQFAGYMGHSAAQLKSVLADLGLTPMGSHIGIDAVSDNLNQVIDYSAELGERYIVVPGLHKHMHDSRDAWLRTAELLNGIGERVVQAGLTFGYHNHSFEFEEFDGQFGLYILLENTDPRYLRLELDTCWADVTGKMRSVDIMRKYAAHLELLHIKEMTAIGDPTALPIGKGAMDFPPIVELGKELGVQWYTIEHEAQDAPNDRVLADITEGAEYLYSLL